MFCKLMPLYLALLLLGAGLTVTAETVPLAASGIPAKSIAIPTTASADLQASAAVLASYLGQITGGAFTTVTFNPATGPNPGIVLGKSSDLNLTDEVPNPGANMKIRERYLLASGNSSGYVFLVGATDLAIRDAVYDFLERLQCRWFFASPNWQIIPSTPNLSWVTPTLLRSKNVTMGTKSVAMSIYVDELPDFKMRYIWAEYCNAGGGNGEWVQQYNDWWDWCKRNRAVNSYTINAGHAYNAIISWATAQGRWSNDYYALINGVRNPNGQFCLSNPALQQILFDYVADKCGVASTESVSLEPRDGGGWCQCANCEAMQSLSTGFVTDRVVIANNYAAGGLPAGKYIGMYAYNQHSDGPSVTVNNGIYVLIATAFLSQGNTVDSLLGEWSAKAQNLGIRDYFSVWDWDHNLPGGGKVANLTYLNERIPYYHINHADVISAESTHAWGPLGLGFYIAARKLWDTNANVEALKTDFLTRCFGDAADTMRQFYDHIDPANRYPLSNDLMGRLYTYVNDARALVTDPAIIARLDDLTLYLHYVDLAQDYGSSSEQVLRFVWKIRNTNMVDSLTCWRNFSGPWPLDGNGNPMNWQVPSPTHPWKEAGTYTHDDIVQMNLDGIDNNPLLPEEPRSFSDDLVPSGATAGTRGTFSRTRGVMYYFLRADASGVLPTLNIANGFSYNNKGDAVWKLYTPDGLTLLESGTIPPDQVVRQVTFTTSGAGNYLFVYDDKTATSSISWAAGSTVSICAGLGRTLWQSGRASRLYFYVPKGTQYVEAYASSISDCSFYNAAGTLKQRYTTNMTNIDIVIPVGPGEDDQMWYVTQMQGVGFQFRNVPGFFALRQDELLIPREAYANLMPSGLAAGTRGSTGGLRGVNYFYLHTKANGSLPTLTINDGAIYTNRGDLQWALYTEDGGTLLQSGTVPPDRLDHAVTFANPAQPGAYLLRTDDNLAGYAVTWPAGDGVSIAVSQARPFRNRTRAGRLYFFVPKGAALITFAADSCSDCNFYNGSGALAYAFPGGTTGSVFVPAGQDGQVWYFTSASTQNLRFLNIPGVMALNKDELLVPHWALTE